MKESKKENPKSGEGIQVGINISDITLLDHVKLVGKIMWEMINLFLSMVFRLMFLIVLGVASLFFRGIGMAVFLRVYKNHVSYATSLNETSFKYMIKTFEAVREKKRRKEEEEIRGDQ